MLSDSEHKMSVVVLFGGMSSEHEVSRVSAGTFVDQLDRQRYELLTIGITKEGRWLYTEADSAQMADGSWEELPGNMPCVLSPDRADHGLILFTPAGQVEKVHVDVVIPVLHGLWGEDGTVQGLLELAGIPYVGCGVLASAVCMDKAVANAMFDASGIPHTKWLSATRWEIESDPDGVCDGVIAKLGWPIFVKPANAGSSVGITKVNSADELDSAITLAASFTDRILAEHAITNLREINCSVLGDADECAASVCEEPFMHDEILSYEDKYMSGSKGGSKGMASLGRKIPADLPDDKSEEIRKLACDVFKAINASGVVRIDFMIDCDTDKVYANEINTIPGSLAFYLWEATGLKYTDMIDRLAEVAFRRQRGRENLTFTIDTNILSGVSFGAKGAKGAKL